MDDLEPASRTSRPILVTGGAGFIGSNFVRHWRKTEGSPVITLDKLTYAGNLDNLADLKDDPDHTFVLGDIGDIDVVKSLLRSERPCALVNFAAESHVDRSILGPDNFIDTNIVGTFRLLECAREYWSKISAEEQPQFRFLQISTDEVYGSLAQNDDPFVETSAYRPNSPYAASKAAADHLVRAWHHTYGLPVLTTTCSNNYGPHQFPEKLIPLMIHHALTGKSLPLYGDGQNIRDWLHVEDHCAGINAVLRRGTPGESYAIGGNCQKTNLEVAHAVCDALDRERPRPDGKSYRSQIAFVTDRPGHDRRYAVNTGKINKLGWQPTETFESGILRTVRWYIDHSTWMEEIAKGTYRKWIKQNYSR